MNWQDKIQITRAELVRRPELAMVFSEGTRGASEQFLLALRENRPFLEGDYLQFLRLENGLQIDTCVLFGSGESQFSPLGKAEKRWTNILDTSKYFVFGEDSSGGCFAVGNDKEIWLYDHDPPDPTNAKRLAIDFADFMTNVLMGPRFVDLFGGITANRVHRLWNVFMSEQGWI